MNFADDNDSYYGCYECGYATNKITALGSELVSAKAENARITAELAMMRKAYAEAAEAKSKLEAKKESLIAELADRDAVVAFLWDKIVK